jgi:hypothetical protein
MGTSDVAMYKVRVSPGSGDVKVGSLDGYCLMSWKACSDFGVHWNEHLVRHFLRVEMNGIDRSACLAKKRLRAASRPFKDYTSFSVGGEGISITARTLSGFALKPSLVTMTPKNWPTSMPKEHFLGFSFIRMDLRWLKVS